MQDDRQQERCFSYTLAADEPLLFTGDAFARTDVRPALNRGV